MKKYKVLGTHTYLGGMLIGLETKSSKQVGSFENWEPGMKASKALGNNIFNFEEDCPKADITVGNPPCSRFSQMTYSMLNKNESLYNDFTQFEQLNDVIETGKKSGSKVIWWETGPLSWNRGQSFFEEINAHLTEYWGQCITLVIRYDLLWSGIPQNRTRCHIIHMNTSTPPPFGFASKHPFDYTVQEWLASATTNYELKTSFVYKEATSGGYTPRDFIKHAQSTWTFNAMIPDVIYNNQKHTGSVVSGRFWAHYEENRFLDLLEYAALQSYPLDKIEAIMETLPHNKKQFALALLSKSVSPTASRDIYENIVKPWMEDEDLGDGGIPWETSFENIYKMNLKPPGIIKGKWTDGNNHRGK